MFKFKLLSTSRLSLLAITAAVTASFAAASLPVLAQVPTQKQESKPWSQLGRKATPAEVKAWDIDVRADFTGLPAGSGSAKLGMDVWEDKCASCHGVFGESNEVFTPVVGGTSAEDIKTGRVAALKRTDYPQRTKIGRAHV